MNVLLVHPRISKDLRHQPYPPLGLIAMGSYLNAQNHNIYIYDRNVAAENVEQIIGEFKPDIVGISVFTGAMIIDACEISRVFKKRSLNVFWGGTHPSLLPRETLQSGVTDFVIIGEGEETVTELLQAILEGSSFKNIKGLGYIHNEEIIVNENRDFVDLSKIPPTDWSLVDVNKYFQGFGDCDRLIRIYTSKGCPGQCTFCYNQSFHKRKWRGRTPEQIVDEIQLLADKYNADGIGFIDELWSPGKERLHRICNLIIERGIKLKWYFNARVDQYLYHDLELMYKAGCRWILFGIESGSPRVLEKIKKGITLHRVKEVFKDCNTLGINTIASFMIGFPGETKTDLNETVKFALELRATYYDFTKYMCYPGTELYDYVVEKGLFNPPDSLIEWANISSWDKIMLNFTDVSDSDLKTISDFFTLINVFRVLDPSERKTLKGYLKKYILSTDLKKITGTAIELMYSAYEIMGIVGGLIINRKKLKEYELSPRFFLKR